MPTCIEKGDPRNAKGYGGQTLTTKSVTTKRKTNQAYLDARQGERQQLWCLFQKISKNHAKRMSKVEIGRQMCTSSAGNATNNRI